MLPLKSISSTLTHASNPQARHIELSLVNCRLSMTRHEPQLWRLEGGDTERAAWEDSKATRLEQIVGGHRGRSRCATTAEIKFPGHGSFGEHNLRGDRAIALIEDIWCEKIRGCSYRGEATRFS